MKTFNELLLKAVDDTPNVESNEEFLRLFGRSVVVGVVQEAMDRMTESGHPKAALFMKLRGVLDEVMQ